MKQTLKIEIEVPKYYKAVYNEDTQKVEVVERCLPKTWEEFCDEYPVKDEYLINGWGNISTVSAKKRHHTEFLVPDRETAEAFLALMQLIQLRDCYRQGWKPDWNKSNVKYSIECGADEGVAGTRKTFISRVLSFQSEEIRDEFLKNFRELIEKAKELI